MEYTAEMIWVISGLVLIVLEFITPGAIIIFFGLAALITGLAVYLELIVTVQNQLLFWVFTSMILVLLLRQQIKKFFPAIVKYDYQDESSEIEGKIVKVSHDISSDHNEGRVKFQGSSYQARSESEAIKAGEYAQIIRRENLVLIVRRSNNPEKKPDNIQY